MTEPMQRPDHEASRWPHDFDIRQRYAEQQELLEPPPARPREEPTADAWSQPAPCLCSRPPRSGSKG
ncbi:TPA: hypothetical protein ACMFRC_004613 [Pseudomonas aeruginosa]